MSDRGKKQNAEEVLDNLARIMSESDPEEKATDGPNESAYIERAMSIVNDWRQSRIVSEGRKKQKRFQEFAARIRELITSGFDENAVTDIGSVNAAAQVAFYRNLKELSKQDAASAEYDKELLRLWSEFCEDTEVENGNGGK